MQKRAIILTPLPMVADELHIQLKASPNRGT